MSKYIGVKLVEAVPMTREEVKSTPYDEPEDHGDPCNKTEGYAVRYPDGYRSWCPKIQFEESNRICNAMPFGHAIEAARKGLKIARAGWNGKNQFVVMQPELKLPPFNTQGTHRKVNDRTAKFIGEDAPLNCPPYFALYNAQQQWVCGWVPSQGDLFADDWCIVETLEKAT